VIDHHQLEGNAVELLEPRSVEIQPWGKPAVHFVPGPDL